MYRICLCICFTLWQGLYAQPDAGDLYQKFQQARVRLDYREALELCVEILQTDPGRLPDLINPPDFFQLAAVQTTRVALSSTAKRALLMMQGYVSKTPDTDKSFWLQERSLTVMFYPNELQDSARRVFRSVLEDDPLKNISLFLDRFGEGLLADVREKRVEVSQAVRDFIFWDNLYRNLDVLAPAARDGAEDLQISLVDALSQRVSNCEDLEREYTVRLDRSLLRPDEYEFLYTALRIQACPETAFVDTVQRRIMPLVPSAYFLRLVGERYLHEEQYTKAQLALEAAVRLPQLPRIKAKNLLLLADVYAVRKSFRTARLIAMQSHEAYPDWGEPWLFQAELVLKSAPFCNFSALERKALNWLAIDFCEKALNANPALERAARSRMELYKKDCPSPEELRFHGFKVGDRFPIPCWIGETTIVRY